MTDLNSLVPAAIQLVLAFDDLPEECVAEAVRSTAGLLAHISPEAVSQPD
jgi:hypothetical protein